MKLIAAFVLTFIAFNASANCTGYGAYRTCYDAQSGNSYTVNRYGNTTRMNGYNSNTGSTWNSTTNRYGNSSNTQGYDSNGNSWNSNTYDYGNGNSTTYGTDSSGKSFYCSTYGGVTTCN